MKIAIFSDTFSPQINGVTKNLDKLIEYLTMKEIDYMVFAPETPGEKEVVYEKNIQRLLSLPFVLYPELRISLPNYIKIRNQLKDFNPDIIHLVTPFNIGLSGFKYARRNNIPFVSSYHTNFDQYLDYYNLQLLEKPVWSYLRWFHNQSFINFCPSQSTMEDLKEKGFINLDVWKRGIDTNQFSPDYRDEDLRRKYNLNDKIVLLYVGRVAPEKNLKLLINSIKILNNKYHDKIALLITGDGPSTKEIKKTSPDNVVFTGFQIGEDLLKIYASADIFTFPSVTETYGNVIIEAMSAGLPVLAILAGGVKENLINNYNGLACRDNDLNEFTDKLERLIINKNIRKELGHNARQYALSLSWDEIFNKLIDSYQKIITDDDLCGDKTA